MAILQVFAANLHIIFHRSQHQLDKKAVARKAKCHVSSSQLSSKMCWVVGAFNLYKLLRTKRVSRVTHEIGQNENFESWYSIEPYCTARCHGRWFGRGLQRAGTWCFLC